MYIYIYIHIIFLITYTYTCGCESPSILHICIAWVCVYITYHIYHTYIYIYIYKRINSQHENCSKTCGHNVHSVQRQGFRQLPKCVGLASFSAQLIYPPSPLAGSNSFNIVWHRHNETALRLQNLDYSDEHHGSSVDF